MISKIDTPYILIEDGAEFRQVVAELVRKPWVAVDVETFGTPGKTPLALRGHEGLDPITATIRLVQLTAGDEIWVVDALRAGGVEPLQLLLNHGRIVAHNAKFELLQFFGAGLKIPPFVQVWDTMLASQILSAGRDDGHHTLEAVAKRVLGLELDKTYQSSDWSGTLTDDQFRYAAMDVNVLIPLRQALEEQLHEAGLDQVMELEMRALPAVAWMEHNGVPIDCERWRLLAQSTEERAKAIEAKLNCLIGNWSGDIASPEGQLSLLNVPTAVVNWNSQKQILAILNSRGIPVTSTDTETLIQYDNYDPIVPLLIEYRQLSRRAGTFGLSVLNQYRHPVTGKIHPNWYQLGAIATGRMSCKNPNLQQIPHSKEYRSAFRPPPRLVMVKADYSQIELRVAAEITKDPILIDIYRRRGDVHAKTAQEVLGKQNVTKEDRQRAKAVNFGFLYGMGPEKFRTYARMTYGVTLTELEARSYRQRFFEAYPGIAQWHRDTNTALSHPITIRTLSGRRRLNVNKLSEALNTPVQGTAADITKAALGALWETRTKHPDSQLVMAVHDELVILCPEEQAEEEANWLQGCMHQAGLRFLTKVPVETEAQIGPSWGEE